MLFPTLDDQVGILIDDRLNLLQVVGLYLLLNKQRKLASIPNKLSHATVAFNVNVDRLMLLAIKEEKPKNLKTSGISLFRFIYRCKYRNYFRYQQLFRE